MNPYHPTLHQQYIDCYKRDGFALVPSLYSITEIGSLVSLLEEQNVFSYQFSDVDSHNLLRSVPIVKEIAESDRILALAQEMVGVSAIPFHAIILDKTKDDNWGLDWHQDLKIAVKRQIHAPGYENWTEESGIPHVIPPATVLRRIGMIRIHLDDCDEQNGAVWAVPQSQKEGIIPAEKIASVVKSTQFYLCSAKAGDVMLMSPLVLHKSPYSLSSRTRRILQISYRTQMELENGLEWL